MRHASRMASFVYLHFDKGVLRNLVNGKDISSTVEAREVRLNVPLNLTSLPRSKHAND